MIPMYRACEDEEYNREVYPAEGVFPRLGPRIFFARGDQPWWAAGGYLDIDSFGQGLERRCGRTVRDQGSQGRHGS